MGLFCSITVVALILFVIIKANSGGAQTALVTSGIRARGILLTVSSTAQSSTQSGMKFETRQVRIDVEVPGAAPYEISASLLIPAQLKNDVLPGATVELRVDPKNPKAMIVIGPGAAMPAALFLSPSAAARNP